MNRRQALRSHEYGGVLITGLLTLILLTAIGLAATRSSVIENEISTNERNYKEAFYAAEMAIQAAEDHLRQLDSRDDYNEGNGHYAQAERPQWDDLKVWHSLNAFNLPALPTGSQHFAEPPRYTMGPFFDRDTWRIGTNPVEGTDFFTVVGHGTGAKKNAEALVTSMFAKRFNTR